MKVSELLSDESKFQPTDMALDVTGFPVPCQCDEAVSFCLCGAMKRCYGEGFTITKEYARFNSEIMQAGYPPGLSRFALLAPWPVVRRVIEKAGV